MDDCELSEVVSVVWRPDKLESDDVDRELLDGSVVLDDDWLDSDSGLCEDHDVDDELLDEVLDDKLEIEDRLDRDDRDDCELNDVLELDKLLVDELESDDIDD